MFHHKRRRIVSNRVIHRKPQLPSRTLYVRKTIELCKISDNERLFIRNWCLKRNLEEIYPVQALTYWIRVKASLLVSFIVREQNRELYMIICVHLALKWHGYDELFKCNFFGDMLELYPSLRCSEHQDMEIEVLRELQWELG